jgi:hypothetical protein
VVTGAEEDPNPDNNTFTVTVPVNFVFGAGCQMTPGMAGGSMTWLWLTALSLVWAVRRRRR